MDKESEARRRKLDEERKTYQGEGNPKKKLLGTYPVAEIGTAISQH